MRNFIKNKDGWFELNQSENMQEPEKTSISGSEIPKIVSEKLSKLVPKDAEFISFSANFDEDKSKVTGSVVFRKKPCEKCINGSLVIKNF